MLVAALLCALWCVPARAAEQINDFHSDITVHRDGSMDVVETICVTSEQDQIQHGIYRDFPTRYKDRYGNNYVVGFKVVSVIRDGAAEQYHTAGMENGVRIYIGDASNYVPVGEHTYVLRYTTDRQLGFFRDHDELYWNVTGNGWVFPIRRASAMVILPPGIPISKVRADGWTGPQGSTARYLTSRIQTGGASFSTTAPLDSYEGLTIAVAWPKGFIDQPTATMKAGWFLGDNRSILFLVIGLIAVLGYFLWAQNRVGIDPVKGAIVPQWEAPDGLSPAAVRYICRMGCDNKTLTAALINAAVKGYITINAEDGVYSIRRISKDTSLLTTEELAATKEMIGLSDFVLLDNTNSMYFQAAIDKLRDTLENHFGRAYFATHVSYALVGMLLSALTLVGSVFVDLTNYQAGGLSILPLGIGAVLFIVMNVVFFRLLRAYTKLGRELMDKAEGLKLYMQVAEQERLDILNPPDRTPQLYEKLLPYALALGVEQQWSEQFADVLAKAQAQGYQPSWYRGPGFYDGDYSGFASSIGNSFSSAISSAATPPGSGSGVFGDGSDGGGGCSGGGGGGGGGGGW